METSTQTRAVFAPRQGATAAAEPSVPTVQKLLESQRRQIAAALPAHMKPEKMLRVALTEIRKNPDLGKCEPLSFLGAIVQCAQLGLEPGNHLGHAYLVPFNNKQKGIKEVQLVVGYRGFIDLARRSGQILSISARCVYQGDQFEYEYGLEEKLIHKPSNEPGELTHVYAVAKLVGGGHQFEILTHDDIDDARRAAASDKVWSKYPDEMARKTAIRRLFKYLPVSVELAKAFEIADSQELDDPISNAHVLIDAGVQAPLPDPREKNEAERLQLVDRIGAMVEEKIADGKTKEQIEKHIGMPFERVPSLEQGQLLAMFEIVRKL